MRISYLATHTIPNSILLINALGFEISDFKLFVPALSRFVLVEEQFKIGEQFVDILEGFEQ
ncbi:hypothetical protein KDK_79340 [Dictyobacter kobayashii]|uniref:Uncharacterized protein n=1 Tax=Dictyobacter kobayashii TaxID=2014872 RepID=A0A402AYH8_9CHLR|nr:hypothetical protein KDK_79340 [Dictyobacter kobayashii]